MYLGTKLGEESVLWCSNSKYFSWLYRSFLQTDESHIKIWLSYMVLRDTENPCHKIALFNLKSKKVLQGIK